MSLDTAIAAGGWIFSVITSFIAYKSATKTFSHTTKDADKSVYVSAVTTERAKWREELRSNVALFIQTSSEESVDISELRRLKAEIVLRLNPRSRDPGMQEKHKYDFQIIKSIEQAVSDIGAGTNTDIVPLLITLELNAQELLKQEWEKSKAEALAGRGKTLPSGAINV